MNCARKKLRISVKKKHENLSVKTRTCFFKKSYVFWMKDHRAFLTLIFSLLYTRLINGLIVRNLS